MRELIYSGRLFKLPPPLWSAVNAIQLRRGDLAITRRAPNALLSFGIAWRKTSAWKELFVSAAQDFISLGVEEMPARMLAQTKSLARHDKIGSIPIIYLG